MSMLGDEDSDYEWLTKMGLCHRCRKEKVAPGKKYCFDCLDKQREENRMRYNPKQAREYQARRKEIYQQKKVNGICVRCSKKATHGLYCYEHAIATRRRSAERADIRKAYRRERGLIPRERKEQGLCLWCGEKAVSRLQCCERHRQIFSEAGKRGKETWAKEIDAFWRKKTNSRNI